MKYRVFATLLAALMLLALSACTNTQADNPTSDPSGNTTGPAKPVYEAIAPQQKDGVYQLTEPGHLLYLAEHPDKNYALCADIDMGGYVWTPVDNFSGSLTGKLYHVYNYSISNLEIQAAAGDTNVGFFRKISGTVQEINFANVTVTAASTFTGNLGVVAGVCETTMIDVDARDCTITVSVKDANLGMLAGQIESAINGGYTSGDLNVTLSGGTCYIGGIVGNAKNLLMGYEARTNINVSGAAAGATGGVAGCSSMMLRDVNYGGHFKVETDSTHAAGTLAGIQTSGAVLMSYNCARSFAVTGAASDSVYVGAVAQGVTVSDCHTRDLSNLDENLPTEELSKRQLVEDYMYRLCTIRWIPTQDIVYKDDCGGTHDQTYYANQIYIGMPYGHDAASLEKLLAFMNPDGTLKEETYYQPIFNTYTGVKAYSAAYPPAGTIYTGSNANIVDVISNNCADSIYWAWSLIDADMDFVLTKGMLFEHGIIPVGEYDITGIKSSKDVCAINSDQTMYEALAKVQMGDALLDGPGHVRMAAEAAYVFRNADGTINGEKSYILMHEQGAGCSLLKARHTTCDTNFKLTFAHLYKTHYIPVTIQAFKETVDEIQVSTTNTATDKTGLAAGKVSSNYRLNWVTVQVLDANGAAIVNKTVFVENNNTGTYEGCYDSATGAYVPWNSADSQPDWILNANSDTMSLEGFAADIAAANLTPGAKYTYKVLVGVSSQEVEVQSFEFTA